MASDFARRHASRALDDGTLVYHAGPTNRSWVGQLGLRPAGTTGRDHRADRCDCPVRSIEAASVWNRNCPPEPAPGERRAWGVLYR